MQTTCIWAWEGWAGTGDVREKARQLHAFVRESNRIEGITRSPSRNEQAAHAFLLGRRSVSIDDLIGFVAVVQPGAMLRDVVGRNVRIGKHIAPKGGAEIRYQLQDLLQSATDAHETHLAYLTLHPFMDGNGRSSRALWLWMKGPQALEMPMLQRFYYDTLARSDGR